MRPWLARQALPAASSAVPQITVGSRRVHVARAGNGPPLLLIHGLGASHADWSEQVAALGARHALVMPDLRGHGRSPADGSYAIVDQARLLLALMDQVLAETGHTRFDVIGHSMGGAVALSMALLAPQRIGRLVISNSMAGFRPDSPRKLTEALMRVAVVATVGVAPLAGIIARRLFPRDDQAHWRATMRQHFAVNSRAVYLRSLTALGRWSVWDRLGEIRCPVLIIAAEQDYFPPEETRAFADALPDCRLLVYANSRHATPIDSASRFNADVLAFLGG